MGRTEKFLNTVAGGVEKITPEMALASVQRKHKKAKNVALAVVLGLLSGVFLLAGGFAVFFFAKAAIAQSQKLDVWLMLTLSVPLVPGFALAVYAALRLDPEAGSALTQFTTFLAGIRAAIKGGA